MRGKRIALAIVVILIALVLGGWGWWVHVHHFDAARWRAAGNACNSAARLDMVDDLRAHHLHRGMTRNQVRQLLGPPVAGWESDENDAEWTTDRSGLFADCFILHARFARGHLIDTYLYGT